MPKRIRSKALTARSGAWVGQVCKTNTWTVCRNSPFAGRHCTHFGYTYFHGCILLPQFVDYKIVSGQGHCSNRSIGQCWGLATPTFPATSTAKFFILYFICHRKLLFSKYLSAQGEDILGNMQSNCTLNFIFFYFFCQKNMCD